MSPVPLEPAVGSELAGYRLEGELGRGASGRVFLAADPRLGRRVALKVLAPRLAGETRFRERFLRESRLAASLDHPHVVPVYEAGDADGVLFIAMRYVDGPDLDTLVRAEGALEPSRALELVRQAAAALDAAHALGLVHRDVKPANILVGPGDHVYLSDFGLMLGPDDAGADAGRFAGTVDYVAPEVVDGSASDARADVYSLACVLFTCLAGGPPFPRESPLATAWAHVLEEPPRVSEAGVGVRPLPRALDDVLGRALSKSPALRQTSCGELARQAQAAFDGPGQAPDAPAVVVTPPSDRRTVTVLFADVSGYTPLAERLDPEQVAEVLAGCVRMLREETELHGGWLEKQIGDAVLAVFGAPVAHEDDPERAVRAALAMRDRMKEVSARVIGTTGTPLELHVGVNTGLVVVEPNLDLDRPGDITVIGDAVNVGARLQQTARPGQVLVGQATRDATAHAFDYRPLPPLRVKGKAGRVTAHECVGRAPATDRNGIDRGRRRVGLVGREAELAALEAVAVRAAAGQGAVVCVLGEAGIGKSRLLGEARPRAEELGLELLVAQAVPFGRELAYAPIVEIVRQSAGIEPDLPDDVSLAELEHAVRHLVSEDPGEIVPFLGTLLALELPEAYAERVRHLDGEAMGRRLFQATRRYVERLAARTPLAIVLEDWHWADEASAALVAHLVPLVDRVPLVLCATARPDPDTPGLRLAALARSVCAERLVQLELEPLSERESATLLARLVGGEEVSPALGRELLRTTEGNPFYLEELVRSLVAAGTLGLGAGRLGGVRAAEPVEIPASLHGVIMARIDGLDPPARDVLYAAAVAGRTFTPQLLARLVDRDPQPALAELTRLGLLREEPGEAGPAYAFRHAVTHEVVYESILLRRRRELHARAARSIEEHDADRLDERYGVLAYHCARAELWAEAQRYLLLAGDQAHQLAADAEALAYYERARDAYARSGGEAWEPEALARLDRKTGEAMWRRGRNEAAAAHLGRGLAQLGVRYPEGRGAVRRAIAAQALRQVGHRALPRHRFRDDVSTAVVERSQLITDLSWIDYFADRERMVLDALLQTNLGEQEGYRLAVARGYSGLGFICDAVPLRRAGGYYQRRCLRLAEEAGDPSTLALAHLGVAHHLHHLVGDWDGGLAAYRQAAEVAWGAGHLPTWGAAMLMLSGIPALRGELAEGAARAAEITGAAAEAGDVQVEAWGEQGAGRVLLLGGRPEEAARRLVRGAELSEAVPDYTALVTTLALLARCELRLGRRDDALARLDRCESLISRHRERGFHCTETLLGRAEACVAALEVESDRGQASATARRACAKLRRQAALDSEAAAPAGRLSGTVRWLAGERRRARRAWESGERDAQRTGARLELARTLVEAGRRTGDGRDAGGLALLHELGADTAP